MTIDLRSSNVLNHTNVTRVGGVLGSPLFGQWPPPRSRSPLQLLTGLGLLTRLGHSVARGQRQRFAMSGTACSHLVTKMRAAGAEDMYAPCSQLTLHG